ncbi:retrotransposon protein, putative, ty3-gypsy subclass [Tanacetum coccineum]
MPRPTTVTKLERLDVELCVRGSGGLLCQNVEEALREKVMTDKHIVSIYYSSRFNQVKIEHQRASGLLQPLEIPMWKWDEISMDFVTGLPTTQKRHDAIWVVVDRLTKSAHFLPIRKNYEIRSLRLVFGKDYRKLGELVLSSVQHFIYLQTVGQDQRGHSDYWKDMFKVLVLRMDRKCRAPICWDEVGERLIEGPELIEITNEKVAVAKEKLKEARSRQKSYADKHRRDFRVSKLEIAYFLKVSAIRKELRRFWDQGQSACPRFHWSRLKFWNNWRGFVSSGLLPQFIARSRCLSCISFEGIPLSSIACRILSF